MTPGAVYEERVSSAKTEALFVGLAFSFLGSFSVRASVSGFGHLAAVFFLFLEHPRVVLGLSKSRGPVREVAFSTRRPVELLDAVEARDGRRDCRTKG